jgi:hypothetical protein
MDKAIMNNGNAKFNINIKNNKDNVINSNINDNIVNNGSLRSNSF